MSLNQDTLDPSTNLNTLAVPSSNVLKNVIIIIFIISIAIIITITIIIIRFTTNNALKSPLSAKVNSHSYLILLDHVFNFIMRCFLHPATNQQQKL